MTVGPGQRIFLNCEIERDDDLHWKHSANNVLRVENCSVIEIIDGVYKSEEDYYEDCCQIQDWVQSLKTVRV